MSTPMGSLRESGTFRSVSSHTISTVGDQESIAMGFVHEAVYGA